MDLKFYLSLFWRRFPYFAFFFTTCAVIGVSLAFLLPPTYRAEARLLMEGQTVDEELADSTVTLEQSEQLANIRERILTRNKLIDLARRLSVYEEMEAAGERLTTEEKVTDMLDRIRIQPPPFGAQAYVVTISFEAPNPTMSATVTNEIVTMILTENRIIRTGLSSQTLTFYQNEVDRLDQELSRLQAQILSFQEANLDSLPDSIEFRRGQLTANQERLLQLEREESILVERRSQLVRIFEATGNAGPQQQQRALTPEARQLQRLEDELAGLLATLSPTHPRVRQLEGQIAAIAPRVAAQESDVAPVDESGNRLTAFEIQLTDIDTQIRFLNEEQERVKATMTALEESIAATPANAIRLATMERDYANLQDQYNEAVSARARAQTGDIIEEQARAGRILTTQNAVTPDSPVSPNRPLLAGAGIGGGLLLGLGVIVLLEAMNKSIRRPVDLTKRLGITPLGAVPQIRTAKDVFRRRAIIGTAFATVLLAIPVGLWAVHTYVTPLDRVVDQVMARIG